MKPTTTFSIIAALLLAAVGCEETLESCAQCGDMASGYITVTGDPRVDGTLEAIYMVDRRGDAAVRQYDELASELAGEYGVSLAQEGRVAAAEAQEIVDRIRAELLEAAGVTAMISVSPGGCWVDKDIAMDRQEACEDRVGLYVVSSCSEDTLGSCTGRCFGACVEGDGSDVLTSCQGDCYTDATEAGDDCLDECIGVCVPDESMTCPGECRGQCDGTCGVFGSSGECVGPCDGICDGYCSSYDPIECQGECRGFCRVAVYDDGTCDGTCLGDCSGGLCAADGKCRGHFRPEGCDLSESTIDSSRDCQEVSRLLAWTYMDCTPAKVTVLLEVTALDSDLIIEAMRRRRQLERVLRTMLSNHAWISIMVDGEDPSGWISAGDLEEEYDSSTVPRPAGDYAITELGTYGYVEARQHLPLTGLKARLGMLNVAAAGGEFEIPAGQISCAQPAVQTGWDMANELIPAEPVYTTDKDGETIVDYYTVTRSEGLYRVLDGMNAFMTLTWGVSDG